jgi:parallel beta-helix repeat protein
MASGVVVHGNTIWGNYEALEGSHYAGIRIESGNDNLIENNTISYSRGAFGINIARGIGNEVAFNTVTILGSYTTAYAPYYNITAMRVREAHESVIHQNTFVGFYKGIWLETDCADNQVLNNHVRGVTPIVFGDAVAGNLIEGNDNN